MNVMSDISSDDLVAVRNRLTGLSFAISVYYLFGGKVMPNEVVVNYCNSIMPDSDTSSSAFITIPFTNIVFCDGSNLIYILWILMGWWLYRYLTLGSWSIFKFGFKRDIASILMQDHDIKTNVNDCIDSNSGSFTNGTKFSYEKKLDKLYIVILSSDCSTILHRLETQSCKINVNSYIYSVFFRGSALTFFLPLLSLFGALIFTVYGWLQ